DTRTDIGLLRITKTGLQTAEFGDSSALRVGDTVYAIGNPGGTEFKGSFTEGMVSAIDRPITSTYKQLSIQHTAAINPGNSGGMLVNAAGQVIGINSQKIVDTQYEGMGFAIPSKLVKEVVDDLVKYNRVPNRPKLGIQYLPATQTQLGYEVVRFRNLPSGSLIIAKIDSDSGFNGSDVQKNDIITHVNGQPLTKADLLPSLIENSSVGDTIKLTIVRVSRSYEVTEFDVTVKLVEDKGAAEEATTEAPNLDFFEQYGY
ncbi:MAG: trypsin-like peptidase domain-containing protein, partial [Oscillospiraceae bacterium]|nr:trypsin-like peptidase domain-containing protein [Oscillospiraceae bacterium]